MSNHHGTPRIFLFFIAVILKLTASAVSGAAFVVHSGLLYTLGIVLWLFWFALLWFIALPVTDALLKKHGRRLKKVAIAIIAFVILLSGLEFFGAMTGKIGDFQSNFLGADTHNLLGALQTGYGYNDSTVLCQQASENLLQGKNPYQSSNIVAGGIEFGVPYDRLTPIQTGRFTGSFPYPTGPEMETVWDEAVLNPADPPPEFESGMNYPAASFVLPALFVAAGITDIRWIYLLFVLAGVIFVVWKSPPKLRLWLLAGIIASVEIWNSLASGETGILFFPFLLASWVMWRKNWWLSAIFMGIAISIKQLPWFFVPFYLILIFRFFGVRRTFLTSAIVLGVFAAFNLPFIMSDPGLWLHSITAPMIDRFFPIGVGFVSLEISGYLKIDSRLFFGALELAAGLAGMIWYYLNCRRYPYTGLILAVLPLFFAWRSLWSYFFYFDVIILAMIISDEYAENKKPLTSALVYPPS
ncbi:glycosyltransferase family 87 protein [Dehalogenimonas formicexedens]|uniref:glycosyltransferase family 87 protein n=1 Tax=Dehalogenimonas formicexedens TaxID=1839801 RepID=UPI0013144E78|nr:hypothetical protein [Dehalogenimonas formicexedens]